MNRDSRCSRRRTRRPGSWSGSGRTSAASASVSSRMFKPSPAASDTSATNDTSGWRFSRRAANRRSVTKPLSIRAPFWGEASVAPRRSRRRRPRLYGAERHASAQIQRRAAETLTAARRLNSSITSPMTASRSSQLSDRSCNQSATRGGSIIPDLAARRVRSRPTCASARRASAPGPRGRLAAVGNSVWPGRRAAALDPTAAN